MTCCVPLAEFGKIYAVISAVDNILPLGLTQAYVFLWEVSSLMISVDDFLAAALRGCCWLVAIALICCVNHYCTCTESFCCLFYNIAATIAAIDFAGALIGVFWCCQLCNDCFGCWCLLFMCDLNITNQLKFLCSFKITS